MLVRFENGTVGTMESSRVSVGPRAEYVVEVYGTKGSARWNFERLNELGASLTGAGAVSVLWSSCMMSGYVDIMVVSRIVDERGMAHLVRSRIRDRTTRSGSTRD